MYELRWVSLYTYASLSLTSLLLSVTFVEGQEVPAKVNRIPWRQLILEMAAILREEAAVMRENVATAQKAYNRFIKTAHEAAEIVGKTPEK